MHEDEPFRRRIDLHRNDASTVTATIEDHIHHFEVQLQHGDGRVAAIDCRAIRAPWSTCPDAVGELVHLVGAPVGTLWRAEQPDRFCTHQLDLASLAVRFAGLDVAHRTLELTVADWAAPTCRPEARADDGRTLRWEVTGSTIVAPAPYAGRVLGAGFTSWAHATLAPDELELAMTLRRAAWMRQSRGLDLDSFERLAESGVKPSTCYATQPARIDIGRRNRGSSIATLEPR